MINVKNVNKHFPESEETQKGHMRQVRSGTRKTNRKVRFVMEGTEQELQEIDADIRELQRKQQDIMIKVYACTAATYTDQTGHFPITSSRGMKYVMVMCEIDGNQILVEPLPNRSAGQLVAAYNKNPSITAADYIVRSARNITDALKGNTPSNLPPQEQKALDRLAKIVTDAAIKYSNKEAEKNA
jgi:hypothetical protein